MEFAPKAGCPLCGVVSNAAHNPLSSPRSPVFLRASPKDPEILWRDDDFTVYRERAHPISSKGHIIIAFNLHVPSIYRLSSTDLPLLVTLKDLATRHLHALVPSGSPASTPTVDTRLHIANDSRFHIGFIAPPFKDNKIPVTDHLHLHAYIEKIDLAGWWRSVAYGPLAWYAIDDLIAEIRETVSNNRVKSGYENRTGAPIDMVPAAGARSGTADGLETTIPGIGRSDADLESGEASPLSLLSSVIPAQISPLRV
ncbi:hypothetical protein CPB85DRAFT_1555656 [Mucidula mucida]|nr:hypothetical protein CPB85DRAFT_1555656 [Mucidula mucida]